MNYFFCNNFLNLSWFISTFGSAASILETENITIAAPEDIVSITKFRPLMNEIGNILNEVIDISQAAEHNKRTCECLLKRIYAANLAVLELKTQGNNRKFFNKKTFVCLQNLVTIITKIKKFMAEISQMKTLLRLKYIISRGSIEKKFKELCREFDNCITSIGLSMFIAMINSMIHPDEEVEELKADQEDLNRVSFKN